MLHMIVHGMLELRYGIEAPEDLHSQWNAAIDNHAGSVAQGCGLADVWLQC